MAFINEDHLNSHKRKHDIDLHLGIDDTTNTTEADQTPTPTRFIRNCEEVGLFQDLQNVNPFDETFRKATELAKTGSLHLPEASSDDSLHTPHLFPAIEEFSSTDNANREFNVILKIDDKQCKSNLNTPKINIDHSTPNIISITTITTPTVNSNDEAIKLKLKETLKNRSKFDSDKSGALANVMQKDVYEQTENINKSVTNNLINSRRINKCKDKSKALKLSRLESKRETNRAAQIRSRERKKHQFRQLANEVVLLRSEIKQFSKENQKLKDEVVWLKTMLLYHKDCPVSQDPRVAEEVNLLRKPAQQENEIQSPVVVKKVVPIHPTPSTFFALAPMPTPVILQVPTQTNSTLLAALTPLLSKPQLISTTISSEGNLPKTIFSNSGSLRVSKINKFKDKTKKVKNK